MVTRISAECLEMQQRDISPFGTIFLRDISREYSCARDALLSPRTVLACSGYCHRLRSEYKPNVILSTKYPWVFSSRFLGTFSKTWKETLIISVPKLNHVHDGRRNGYQNNKNDPELDDARGLHFEFCFEAGTSQKCDEMHSLVLRTQMN